MTMKSDIYYNVEEDIKAFPNCWCFLVVGGRNTGKTYGGLKYCIQNNKKFVFVKRTNKDVEILCAGNSLTKKLPDFDIDLSPMVPINRDLGTNIKAFKLDDGIGAFYNTADGGPTGSPVAFIVSLYAIGKFKGFDMSVCDVIIFDEFIPNKFERVSAEEGNQLMDLYKTVARDRELRGRDELKLLCFANAVNIFNYTAETLEVSDVMADMNANSKELTVLEDRGIFIRLLKTPDKMMEQEKKSGIYRAMHNTAWGRMAFGNEFAFNDFSNLKKTALKHYRPYIHLIYKNKNYYIYESDNGFYMCTSRANCPQEFNLNTEMGQRSFYYSYCIDLVRECMDSRMKFEKYTMYDLIVNFKKRFKIS